MTTDDTAPIRQYLKPLSDYKWLVAAVTVVAVGLGVLAGFAAPTAYTSTTTIVVYPISGDPTKALESDDSGVDMATELRIATSQAVMDVVDEKLTDQSIELISSDIEDNVSATTTKESRILDIAFDAGSPEVAQAGANAFAEAYLGFRADLVNRNKLAAETTINGRIAVLQERLAEVSVRLTSTDGESAAGVILAVEESSIQGELRAQQGALADLSTLTVDPTRVIDPADLPQYPNGLSFIQTLIGAIAGGLVLGIVAAYVLAAFVGGNQPHNRRIADKQTPQLMESIHGVMNAISGVTSPSGLPSEDEQSVAPSGPSSEATTKSLTATAPSTSTTTPAPAATSSKVSQATAPAPTPSPAPTKTPAPAPAPPPAPETKPALSPTSTAAPSQTSAAAVSATVAAQPLTAGSGSNATAATPRPGPATTQTTAVPQALTQPATQATPVASSPAAAGQGPAASTPPVSGPSPTSTSTLEPALATPPTPPPALQAPKSPAGHKVGRPAVKADDDVTTDLDVAADDDAADDTAVHVLPSEDITADFDVAAPAANSADDSESTPGAAEETLLTTSEAQALGGQSPAVGNVDQLIAKENMDDLIDHLQALGALGPVAALSVGDIGAASALAVAFELAGELQGLGARVLLIDASVDQPMLHSLVRFDPGPGLAEVLSGKTPLPQAVRPLAGIDGLDTLTIGSVDTTTMATVAGPAFERLMAEARTAYHLILVVAGSVYDNVTVPSLALCTDGIILGTSQPTGEEARPELSHRLASLAVPTLDLISAVSATARLQDAIATAPSM